MGKMFTTSRVGNKVMANYDNSHMYALYFKDEAEAKAFYADAKYAIWGPMPG